MNRPTKAVATILLVAMIIVLLAIAVFRNVSLAKTERERNNQDGKRVTDSSVEPASEEIPAIFAREGKGGPGGND